MNWSNPYYGMTHLDGLKSGFQVTVIDLGTTAECKVFLPSAGFNADVSRHENVSEAKAFGEERAQLLDAIAGGSA